MDSEMQQCKVNWNLQRTALFPQDMLGLLLCPSYVPGLGTYAVPSPVNINGKFHLYHQIQQ